MGSWSKSCKRFSPFPGMLGVVWGWISVSGAHREGSHRAQHEPELYRSLWTQGIPALRLSGEGVWPHLQRSLLAKVPTLSCGAMGPGRVTGGSEGDKPQ